MAELKIVKENKNLVTCKPSEFLRQTNRIRKAAEKWLTNTEILKIRNRKIKGLKPVPKPGEATDEQRTAIIKENADAISAQQKRNLTEILDNIMEKYPDETLKLLGLMCFVEPDDVDNYPVTFYLRNFSEVISDKDVLGFFTSLIQLEQTGTSGR